MEKQTDKLEQFNQLMDQRKTNQQKVVLIQETVKLLEELKLLVESTGNGLSDDIKHQLTTLNQTLSNNPIPIQDKLHLTIIDHQPNQG